MQLQYRPWSGTPRAAFWSIGPIAGVSLRLLLQRRLFWFLYVLALFIFFTFFFGSFLLDLLQSLFSEGPVQLGKMKIDSGKAMEVIRQRSKVLSGTRETYAAFFNFQGVMTIIVLCLSGAVLVGNDFSQRAVPFYLAKPIQPWHYLAGKFLAIGIVINLLTTVPALALYTQQATSNWDYVLDVDFFAATDGGPAGWRLLGGILSYGLLLTVVLGLILLATSALVQRTMPLILVWTSLFLFLGRLSKGLVEELHLNENWRLLDLWNSLTLLGQWLLGFEHDKTNPKPQPSFEAAALVLGGVCILCVILLKRRMTRLEIVRSA